MTAASTIFAGCLALALCGHTRAAVSVRMGPTPIVKGDARAAGDITVMNERLAFSLAVQSAVPYGVPRGALIDLAPVVGGKAGRDRVVFADFIPDHWSAWPNTYQHVDVVEHGPQRAVVRTIRDWGQVTITTVYTLEANSDHAVIETTMRNEGKTALPGLLSGLTLWPNSGFFFGVPGLQDVAEAVAESPLAHRVVAYDADWAIALHADYFDRVGDESKDLYRLNTLAAGESRSFEGWLQVRSDGDLAPIVSAEIGRRHLPAGSLHGVVQDSGAGPVPRPVVVVEKNGVPYAWVMGRDGRYAMSLPVGDYRVYATAKNYSQSATSDIVVAAGADLELDFKELLPPGRANFVVVEPGGEARDARLGVSEGQKPVVEFLGRRIFFTELERRGRADLPIAPGHYVFSVSGSGGFLGPEVRVPLDVGSGATAASTVVLPELFHPRKAGWYSADLHHHSDQAEAVTPPADLARSQLAAGLDVLFVSDHDSTVNHRALQRIADRRGVPFIPAVELSASWGHFNAYPLRLGRKLGIDTSVATVQDLFGEARRQGAVVVQVNHPFIPYGYLTSVAAGVVPGGFDPAFELLEINASAPEDDTRVLKALWDYWNQGKPYYLGAGTDTHDVWNSTSGSVRAYAHVDGPLTARTFAKALKAGHAYVTQGPLLYPDVLFGAERHFEPGRPFDLAVDLESVAGLKNVQLIGGGVLLETRTFAGTHAEHVAFTMTASHPTWYSLVVEDSKGGHAYSDPIWIR